MCTLLQENYTTLYHYIAVVILYIAKKKKTNILLLISKCIIIYYTCYLSLFVTVTVPLVPVDAVEGRTVKFPCDVSSDNPADKVYMVFWFKDDSGVPLYR